MFIGCHKSVMQQYSGIDITSKEMPIGNLHYRVIKPLCSGTTFWLTLRIPLKSRPHLEELCPPQKQKKDSRKSFFFCKTIEVHGGGEGGLLCRFFYF